MKIEIERSGGLSGFINTVSLDTKTLPKELAHKIESQLVKKTSENERIMTMKKKIATPDCYSYRISFLVGNEERKLEFNEFEDEHLVSIINNLLRKKSKLK